MNRNLICGKEKKILQNLTFEIGMRVSRMYLETLKGPARNGNWYEETVV